MVAATYGFVSAFGQNIALIAARTTGMKWFPHRKGLAMGCVVGGFGGGSLVFNYIITAIINPDNISPASFRSSVSSSPASCRSSVTSSSRSSVSTCTVSSRTTSSRCSRTA